MPAASDVTRLLDDIEARQQSVIEELDTLLARIEAVIAEHTPAKQADPTAATAPGAAAMSELAEPAGESESDTAGELVADSVGLDSNENDAEATAKPRRRKKAA